MDRCGVEGCERATAFMLPWAHNEHFPLCAEHAEGWHGSKIRKVLREESANLSDVERRRAFKLWTITEAIGKDPQKTLRTEGDAVSAALHSLH